MRITHGRDVAYEKTRSGHREAKIAFKYLLRGERGSRQNYEFMLAASEEGFPSPPHHHNFDQIRVGIKGLFGDGHGADLAEYDVGYYPEGAWYSIDTKETEVLLLQFGGASGWGFTHFEQLFEAFPQLKASGEFRDGRYYPKEPTGAAEWLDGYEAVWQHINGRAVEYPKPRYARPLIMPADAFSWVPLDGQPGVQCKRMGTFTERDISVGYTRIDPGHSWQISVAEAPILIYVFQGTGRVGKVAIEIGDAIELSTGDVATVSASSDLLLFHAKLPTFAADELSTGLAIAA